MEVYVTKHDFEHVLMELKRLQNFLTDTFGSKFAEFKCTDDIAEIKRSLGIDVCPVGNAKQSNIIAVEYKEPISIVDPLEANDEVNRGPVVTSTKSLLHDLPRMPEITKPNEAVTVPILNTNQVSISIPRVIPTSFQQKQHDPMQSNQRYSKQKEQLVSVAEALSIIQERRISGLQPTPLRETQSTPAKQSIGVVSAVPSELQCKNSMVYLKPNPFSVSSNISDDKASSNDSVPIAIGIETTEDIPNPAKRRRLPPLPSFRNRSLKLQDIPLKPQEKTIQSSTASFQTKSTDMGNEIIQCDLCSLFIYSSQMTSHMKNHSILDGKSAEKLNPLMTSKLQICPLCSIECNDLQAYEQHCADNHPTDGFPCPLCSSRMSSKSKLKRHMSIHKNLKFECNICGKAYNRSDNLKAHYKTHSVNEPVSVFYCPVCNNAFSSRPGRDKHIDCAHPPARASGDNDSPSSDSSDNETDDSANTDAIVTTERIKLENSVNLQEVEFEYEGDDDDL